MHFTKIPSLARALLDSIVFYLQVGSLTNHDALLPHYTLLGKLLYQLPLLAAKLLQGYGKFFVMVNPYSFNHDCSRRQILLFLFCPKLGKKLRGHIAIACADPEEGIGVPDPPPPGKSQSYRAPLANCHPKKIKKLPSQHSMLGHHRPASETPFKWVFAVRPLMAHF